MAEYVSDTHDLAYFTRFKVDVLKTFLRVRGLKTTGKKEELAALAYGAEQLRVPLVATPDEVKTSKAKDYQKLLSPADGVKLADPFYDLPDGWVGEDKGITSWPCIMQCDLTEYLLTRDDSEIGKRLLSDYKEGKAYSYFDSKWLKEVFFHKISDDSEWCFLKAECTPSDSIGNPDHRIWVMVTKGTGQVNSAYCTCFAGLGSTCNHVAALLFKVEYACQRGFVNESCTSKPCSWNQYGSTKKDVQPMRVKDMKWRKPHYNKKDKDTCINPDKRQLFSPTEHSASMRDNPLKLTGILVTMYPSCPNACIFKYVDIPLPDVEHPEEDYNVLREEDVVTLETAPKPPTNLPVNSLDLGDFVNEVPIYTACQVSALEEETRGQRQNTMWFDQRLGRITGSVIHDVKTKVESLFKAKQEINTSALLGKIINGSTVNPNLPALKYGRQNEGQGH